MRHLSAATVLGGFALVGCGGDERSVAAFCSTIESEQDRILDQFDRNGGNAEIDSWESFFAGMGASVQMLGEVSTYFEKLAKVAPPEVQTEAEIVAREYEKLVDGVGDAVSNPLGGLVSGLVSSVQMSGPLDTLDRFAVENCGMHL